MIATRQQKITSLLSKDMLFCLCLMGSDFFTGDDEKHCLRDKGGERVE